MVYITISYDMILYDYMISKELTLFDPQPLVVSKFRQSGFAAVDATEDNPDSHLKKPGSPPQKIISHIFLQDMQQPELTAHVVVFYPRSTFLWTSQIQMPTSDLSFGTTARAYDL